MQPSTDKLVRELAKNLLEHDWRIATAESCTGGGLSYALTNVPGSSAWFERGFVTYSNTAKEELLNVSPATLFLYGAVSEQTAREMAEGALRQSHADISISITGIAGPEGGTPDKPVGMVWFACSTVESGTTAWVETFSGNREAVREQSIELALKKLVLASKN